MLNDRLKVRFRRARGTRRNHQNGDNKGRDMARNSFSVLISLGLKVKGKEFWKEKK